MALHLWPLPLPDWSACCYRTWYPDRSSRTCKGQVMAVTSTVRRNDSCILYERGGAMTSHFGPMARLSLRSRVTRGQSSASASATYQAS